MILTVQCPLTVCAAMNQLNLYKKKNNHFLHSDWFEVIYDVVLNTEMLQEIIYYMDACPKEGCASRMNQINRNML